MALTSTPNQLSDGSSTQLYSPSKAATIKKNKQNKEKEAK